MTSSNALSFETLSTLLQQHNISSDAAEIQGILCGMLSGGMPLETRDWLEPLSDVVNQNEPFDPAVKSAIVNLFDLTCQQMLDTDFALALCLPDDAAPINDRGRALIHWVQGFMLGFGLHQADLTRCSEDVKEGLNDFAEISRMDEDMPADEEAEQALFEVAEYVRMTCLLCFNELGRSAASEQQTPKTMH
ncbi:UPF0149 family protein [Aestuariibacter halophilus]|uniref:UPF0149 family protein n=1 Tax=Fluctibacter halophilus TaxID=226011 RepID=A0ABS8G7C9_9ALTE|nr:UPF0149 family protein [Aestuariibacter halophilus]MCC2616497.1 UPF0149 family protein [Aestuariibacter halophilus]